MKKLLYKDKKIRQKLILSEKQRFILKSIFNNTNFFILIRWNAFLQLNKLINKNNSMISTTNRCLYSINKKRLNKLTSFSRHTFLKLIRTGYVNGVRKSSW